MPEVVLRVAMSCGGCSGAVERILNKTEGAPPPRLHDAPRGGASLLRFPCTRSRRPPPEAGGTQGVREVPADARVRPPPPPLAAGVESFDIDLEAKKVTVRGSLEPGAVVEVVAKSGKATELW